MNRGIAARFLKNKTATSTSFVLLVVCLGAFLSPWITMDKTKNANNQVLPVALKPPGYTTKILKRVKNVSNQEQRTRPDDYRPGVSNSEWIPYERLRFMRGEADVIFEGTKRQMPVGDVLMPLEPGTFPELIEDTLHMRDVFGQKHSLDTTSAYHLIRANHTTTATYFFGSDKYGRDLLSRILSGMRLSLLIGLLSVAVSIFIGLLVGATGGYLGGRVDKLIVLLINTSWSIPTLLMAFAVIIAFGKGLAVIVLAVGLTMWVDVARLVRGQVMQLKHELFVRSAAVLGLSAWRIVVFHILPNMLGPLLVIGAANFATAVLVEAGLSYLGLGIQPPTPSLGNMLQENYAYATGGFVYLAIFPIISIMTLVLCFNLLGTALRDVFDVKTKLR